jgi:uncharacterized OsmC-like protein
MAYQDIGAALKRAEAVLRQRPSIGLQDDSPATSRWDGGLRFVATHPNGAEIRSDMPKEFGGDGEQVSPGWIFRAGLASCTATVIAIIAALEDIELTSLELTTSSRSDSRGTLGMGEADGRGPVSAGPRDVRMVVRIAADGVSPERLTALVEKAYRCSPAATAMEQAQDVELSIEVTDA